MKKQSLPTSKQVAERAKVSQPTVSRVFSGVEGISEATKKRVIRAAQELGYRPNAIARSLILNRSNLIAMVALGVQNPYYNVVINEVASRIQKMNREPLFFIVEEEKGVDQILGQVMQYQVDGIIVLSAEMSHAMAAEFEKVKTPVVIFNKLTHIANVKTICSDNEKAGRDAADHLYSHGYRKPVFVGSSTFNETSLTRQKGFVSRFEDLGCMVQISQQTPYSYQSGKWVIENLVKSQTPFDSIFCAADLLALGVIDQLRNSSIRIPEDVGVIGFDDIESASWPPYQLTTFSQKTETMLDACFDYLDRKLEGHENGNDIQLFPCELIQRKTT
jgi:DNA-binding LacI/PurR family transcriptional regulator